MLGIPQTWVSLDSGPWGEAPTGRTPGLPPDGLKAGLLNNCTVCEQEAVKVVLNQTGPAQAFLVASPRWGADAAPAARAAYGEIGRVLNDQGLTIVHERLFGSLAVKPAVLAARDAALCAGDIPVDGPITYIQGHPPWGDGLTGVVIQAVSCRDSKDRVWTIRDRGMAVGRGWRQGEATFLILQNVQGQAHNGNGANARPLQTQRLIQRAAHLLQAQGASYRDVVRTWFYLSDILDWYPEFNQARNAVYRELGLIPGNGDGPRRLPASTGIRGEAPSGTAGALDLLAVLGPPESRPLVRQLSSPGQQDAFQYGSAFSRGALIRQPEVNLIQVSGTAAIDRHGQSLYPHDIRGQIDCTLEKIAVLIGQVGARLTDVTAACVFVKHPEHAQVYQEQLTEWGLEDFPAVVMVADVCRPELLFEIDADVAF